MMRIAFKTFGCKANSTDTDALYLEAKRRGFEIVDDSAPADAYVINTCTVTENADRDARHQANRFKRQNQGALVAMVGCYAQVAKDDLLALAEVDFVVGTANKFKVLDHLYNSLNNIEVDRDQVESAAGFLPETFPGSRHARASVKIQDGCNYKCSFCIIPQARGRSRSLSIESILKQIEDAYLEGFEEVVLTGIHIAHYGWDHNTDLGELLRQIFENTSGPRIRLSSLDPFEIPDSILELYAKEERFCPHFHIALQSGSDSVLSRMRRIYKAEEFLHTTQKIKFIRPDTFIGVDVIVGFPGETEAEFQETLDILAKSYWTKLHVFSYSERRGTAASELSDKLKDSVISKRSEILRRLSDYQHSQFLNSQIGKTKNIILEQPAKKHPGVWLGHTENYIPIFTRVNNPESKRTIQGVLRTVEGEKIWAEGLIS